MEKLLHCAVPVKEWKYFDTTYQFAAIPV